MSVPQQPEVRRSETTPIQPDSIESQIEARRPVQRDGEGGPVPPDNQPGHRPDQDQDKPDMDAFVAAFTKDPDDGPDDEGGVGADEEERSDEQVTAEAPPEEGSDREAPVELEAGTEAIPIEAAPTMGALDPAPEPEPGDPIPLQPVGAERGEPSRAAALIPEPDPAEVTPLASVQDMTTVRAERSGAAVSSPAAAGAPGPAASGPGAPRPAGGADRSLPLPRPSAAVLTSPRALTGFTLRVWAASLDASGRLLRAAAERIDRR